MARNLQTVSTKVLEDVRNYLDSEVYACVHESIKPEDKPAFEALIAIVEKELWRRPGYRRRVRETERAEARTRTTHDPSGEKR